MYHLLVKYDGWAQAKDSIAQERVFEFPSDTIIKQFKPEGNLNTDLITITPALFVSETGGKGEQKARIGSVDRAEILTNKVRIEYSLYEGIPPISNSSLEELATDFGY